MGKTLNGDKGTATYSFKNIFSESKSTTSVCQILSYYAIALLSC